MGGGGGGASTGEDGAGDDDAATRLNAMVLDAAAQVVGQALAAQVNPKP